MSGRNDSGNARKAIAKKIKEITDIANDVLYTYDFNNEPINFVVNRKLAKQRYHIRLDVTPFKKKVD